jgi:hypothetical protein
MEYKINMRDVLSILSRWCQATLAVTLAFAVQSLAARAATPIQPGDLPAERTLINFEVDPANNPVSLGTYAGSIWWSLGVNFDSNDWVGDPPAGAFNITSPPNTLSGDNTSALQAINATFSQSVTVVGAWGFDFALEVFGEDNASLGTVMHTDGSPGLYGGTAEFGFIGLQSDVPIKRAQFRRAFQNQTAFGYHIDDLVFLQFPPQPGDYNGNHIVDAADYTVWRNNLGSADETALRGGGNGMNGVDYGDYELWKLNYGLTNVPLTSGASLSTAVPEPTSFHLFGVAATIAAAWGRCRFTRNRSRHSFVNALSHI